MNSHNGAKVYARRANEFAPTLFSVTAVFSVVKNLLSEIDFTTWTPV